MFRSTLWSIFTHRELVREMVLRDLKGRNKGAVLGLLWIFLRPLIQTAAYVAIVSFVFKSKATASDGVFDYSLYVLSGMIAWQVMSRTLEDAPNLVRDRMDLVKQVIYPIETLPMTSMVVGSFGSLVSLALYVALAAYAGQARWSFLLLPVPLVLLTVMLLGASWLMMIAGVILKDLREINSLLLGILVYFSPVVVSPGMVSERGWNIILLNPLSHVVICFRDVFLGELHGLSWGVFAGMAAVSLAAGSLVMARTKLLINEYL